MKRDGHIRLGIGVGVSGPRRMHCDDLVLWLIPSWIFLSRKRGPVHNDARARRGEDAHKADLIYLGGKSDAVVY